MATGHEGAGHTDAADLIAQMHREAPPELTSAMQRHKDPDATRALDMEAESGRLGVKVLTAAVYGLPSEGDQKLVYLYESDDGRTHRWFEDYEGSESEESDEPEADPRENLPDPADTEPWPSYSVQSVAEITAQLPHLTDEQLDGLVEFEKAHKNRKGVLDAVEARRG